MRALQDDELDLVVGGEDEEEIIVWGDPDDDEYDPENDGEPDEDEDDGDGDGGDGGGEGGDSTETFPANVPVAEIRAKALEFAQATQSATIEFGAFIYVKDGVVYLSQTYTIYSSVHLSGDITSLVPEGATVIGNVHNHPNGDPLASTSYQDGDWNAHEVWTNTDYSPWGIEVDPNMTLYVAVDGHVVEYTPEDFDTTDPDDGTVITG